MPKLTCPKCKQPIELKAVPADYKVKCGSCSAQFTLKAPAAAGNTARPAPAATTAKTSSGAAASAKARPVDPNDPFASIDLNTLGKGNRVDFGVAPVASGVAESPVGGSAPWLPGNSAAYVPLTEEEAANLTANAGKPGSKSVASMPTKTAPKKSAINGVTIAVGSLVALMVIGVFVIAVVAGKAGSGGGAAVAERPQFKVPTEWEVFSQKGVDGIMPKVEKKKNRIPGSFDGRLTQSPVTQSYFLFYVTDQVSGEINAERMAKVARGIISGDVLGPSEITVAGHKGWRGSHATGVFLPLDDRFILRGYMAYSATKTGFDPDLKIDSVAEQAEINLFKEQLYVGKKPGMFGF
jgi:hypothetical protein